MPEGTEPQNCLLARLPRAALDRLAPHLVPVVLARGTALFRAHEPLRDVYFPTTAVVSLVSALPSGESLEVGIVGRDGLAGTAVFPGVSTMVCDGVVQIPGGAYRVSADVLRREVLADQALNATVGSFALLLLAQTMQISACNAFHPVDQRCMRWLLIASDLIDSDDVPLTHELLATLLGVHRPTVTVVMRDLRNAGIIDERRGLIRILNRRAMEHAGCECYGQIKSVRLRLAGR